MLTIDEMLVLLEKVNTQETHVVLEPAQYKPTLGKQKGYIFNNKFYESDETQEYVGILNPSLNI